nr:hypothetical protein [Tanacetum cinerariifolium]
VTLGYSMYHLMIQRKNFHGILPMMKRVMSRLRVKKRVKETRLMKVMMLSDAGNNNDDDETVKAGSESDKDDDDNDDEEEPAKNDNEDTESGKGGDEVSECEGESDEEETRQEEEESFDPIPRTPEGRLRISEEERMQEKDEADELYRDVDISQGRGLQVSQDIEDSHVTLTPTHSDGQQESSSTSSFVTNLLNPIIDP